MGDGKYIELIKKRITSSEKGSVFILSDFLDIASYETVKKCITRLMNKGTIRKILSGVYEYPEYSELLDEYVYPSPHVVALALARKSNWTVAPCGDTALNQLGLSTQVVTTWSYISDGPYRKYEFDNISLEFKHAANKEISGKSYITKLVIQAIKTLGKNYINDLIIEKISNQLTEQEKNTLREESRQTTVWICVVIQKICNDKEITYVSNC